MQVLNITLLIFFYKMATRTRFYSIGTGSDRVSFFCCKSCKEKDIVENAVCYCEHCQQCFCRKCCGLHDQLFSKHVKYDRGNTKNWPVSEELEAVLRMCEIHTNKRLERFCNDCCELCCSKCVSLRHSKCRKVTLDSAKKRAPDVNEMSVKLRINLIKLKKLQSCCESSIQDLKGSYQQQKLMVRNMQKHFFSNMDKKLRSTLKKTAEDEQNMVKQIHKSMHSTLCDIEKNTLDETKRTLLSVQASLKTGVETCILYQNELKTLNELLMYSSDKNRKTLCFIAGRKCVDKIKNVESYIGENCNKLESSVLNQTLKDTEQFIFKLSGLGKLVKSIKTTYDIKQYLSKLARLGRIVCSNYVFTLCGKSEHFWGTDRWNIAAICVLHGGEILVLDKFCNEVKFLDQQYQKVTHYGVAAGSKDMCLVTSSEVALTVDYGKTHEVQFIIVTPHQLVTGKKIQLQHTCSGIVHHQGDLFITSDTALYQYSLSGKQISKLYEDKSGVLTVWKCAVSPTGDKLYTIKRHEHRLLTLARDGTVLASFRDPHLQCPGALHVTPAGQVLVCYGSWPQRFILQVHNEGRMKLATLATLKVGMWGLVSFCFNVKTSSIIVGQYNKILMFKVK